jgi:hypothetical protein
MRIANSVLAVLLSLLLIAAAVVVPVEVVFALLGREHWVLPWEGFADSLRNSTWDAGPVRAALIVLGVLGLLLLAAQLKPRRPRELRLQPLTEGVQAGTSRRSLQRSLTRASSDVDGVSQSSVRARRRSVAVTAVTRLRDPGDLESRVAAAVQSRLDSLGLESSPKVKVSVSKEARS